MIAASTKARMPGADHCRRRTRVVIVEGNRGAADSLRLLLGLQGYEIVTKGLLSHYRELFIMNC
jgi:hypothetical protein